MHGIDACPGKWITRNRYLLTRSAHTFIMYSVLRDCTVLRPYAIWHPGHLGHTRFCTTFSASTLVIRIHWGCMLWNCWIYSRGFWEAKTQFYESGVLYVLAFQSSWDAH